MAQENKMGVMPTGPLLWSMNRYTYRSMLVSALYNIVDSMFIARISDDALTAVSLCFPVQLLMIALATGIGVGLNVLLSQALGAGDRTSADRIAGNGIFLSLVCWGLFAVIGWFGSTPFLALFTKKAAILSMGTDYLRVCTLFSCGVFLLFTAERLMQATGKNGLSYDHPVHRRGHQCGFGPNFDFWPAGRAGVGREGRRHCHGHRPVYGHGHRLPAQLQTQS